MPNSTYGFTGADIIGVVQSYLGNYSSDLQTYLTNMLPLAEMAFCKMHDWNFLLKDNLSFSVTSGTNEYNLDSTTIGYYMAASDVKTIFNPSGNCVLVKTTLDDIRRMDPSTSYGTATTNITHWAPLSDNRIIVWPPVFQTTSLSVDGEITPNALLTTSNYPTIPFRYQESFIQYMIVLGLDRSNDDRFPAKQQMVEKLIKRDIAADLSGLGDVKQPRFRHPQEAIRDGVGSNLEQLYNLWAFNSYE